MLVVERRPFCMDFASSVLSVRCVVPPFLAWFGGITLRLGAWDFFAVLFCSVLSFSAAEFGDTRGREDDTRGALGGGDDLWCWRWRHRPFCMCLVFSVWSVNRSSPLFLFWALLVPSVFGALLRLCFPLGS